MAPKMEDFKGDYGAYGSAYNLYLELVKGFNLAVSQEVEADKPTVKVDVNANTVTVQGNNNVGLPEASNTEIGRRKVNDWLVDVDLPERPAPEKVKNVRKNFPMAADRTLQQLYEVAVKEQDKPFNLQSCPKPTQVHLALADIYTIPALSYLLNAGRFPKTYRSLYNLREMSMRHCAKANKTSLNVDDVKKFRTDSSGKKLPANP